MTTAVEVPPGLKGVAVTETQIGDVRGLEGFYHYRQYSATELASGRSLEDVWRLLLDGSLPGDADSRDAFAAEVRAGRALPPELVRLLPGIAASTRGPESLGGLRTALSALGGAVGMRPLWDLDANARRRDLIRLAAVTPTLVAALHRLGAGKEPITPDPDLGHVANYLWMVTGERPSPEVAQAVASEPHTAK